MVVGGSVVVGGCVVVGASVVVGGCVVVGFGVVAGGRVVEVSDKSKSYVVVLSSAMK